MRAKINIQKQVIKSKNDIRILGLQINAKLS